MNEKQPQPTPPPPQTKSGGNLVLIIVIIVVALAVLGVGGYFGWKYIASKFLTKADTTPATSTSTNTSTSTTPSATTTPSTSTDTTTSNSTDKKTITTNYVIADSNSRVIAEAELISLTPWELKVARNEIYARHGRPFVHKDLQCYFKTKSWYTINPNYSDSMLTAIDNKNVATIQAYEEKINSPLQSKDTGC